MKRFIVIDGNALVHRAYHALPRLTNKKGEVVNAVYGFSSIFLKVLKELNPDYLAVTFDLAGPTFRHEKYEEYKAKRQKAPQELYDQLSRVKEVVRAFGAPIFEQAGYEADDMIGTIANQTKDMEVIIVTGDMDTLQLINERVRVYAPKKGIKETMIYDEDEVVKKYSLEPRQMIDYKGLRGDPSDNIPGAPGVGEKTATVLLKQFDSIESLYKEIEKNPKIINSKLAEKLIQYKDQVIFSKYLATIRTDAPIKINLDECDLDNYNRDKVAAIFTELGFNSLISRLPGAPTQNALKL